MGVVTIAQISGHGGRSPEWIALCRATLTPAELGAVLFSEFGVEDPGYWSSFAIVNVAGLGDVLLEWQSPYEVDVEPRRDTLMVATSESARLSDETARRS